MENTVYDAGNGQLVTGSFMDYAMPRAEDMPPLRDALYDVPATTNPLGVKGVGEAGTTAAISAVMNAVADAIPGGAGNHLDMPATAQRLWEACQRAKALRRLQFGLAAQADSRRYCAPIGRTRPQGCAVRRTDRRNALETIMPRTNFCC